MRHLTMQQIESESSPGKRLKRMHLWMALALGVLISPCAGLTGSLQAAPQDSPPVRPVGTVTEIKPGSLTLRTDAGPVLAIQIPEGVPVLRVPPGAKDLSAATRITPADIKAGDRVIAQGHASGGPNSLVASKLLVMSEADLTQERETQRREWREHGIGGLVKAVNPAAKEITISAPTPGNPGHSVVISVGANAELLRYAPDSVKFSDARPGTFEQIQAGDQVRALGTRSADGSHFEATRLVSGTFRNIGAKVVSVDSQTGTVTLKELATGKVVVARTNADSRMHQLPPSVAEMLARWNAGGASPDKAPAGNAPAKSPDHGPDGQPRHGDIQAVIEHTPPLTLDELKPGEPLIVVSTEGSKPSEVTAIMVLAGVEPILAAQPKGSKEMVLKQWNLAINDDTGER